MTGLRSSGETACAKDLPRSLPPTQRLDDRDARLSAVYRTLSFMRPLIAATVCALSFASIGACGDSGSAESQDDLSVAAPEVPASDSPVLSPSKDASSVLTTEDGTSVLVLGPADAGMAALASGALNVTAGCLGLDTGTEHTVVMWPSGTRVTQNPTGIILDGKTYRLGDKVKLGGGFVDHLEPSSSFHDRIPADCRSQEFFVAAPIDGPGEVPLSDEELGIIDASRASVTAPVKFRERTQLVDCGEKKLTSLTGTDPRDFDCLTPSNRPQTAELVTLRRTVEGDPIVTYYRVGPDIDGIEVFIDNTLDRYRSKDWTHHRRTMDELVELGI